MEIYQWIFLFVSLKKVDFQGGGGWEFFLNKGMAGQIYLGTPGLEWLRTEFVTHKYDFISG